MSNIKTTTRAVRAAMSAGRAERARCVLAACIVGSVSLLCVISDGNAQGFTGEGVVWDDIVDPNKVEYERALAEAEVAISNGQHDRAIALYEEAWALRPDLAEPVHHIVSAMLSSGQFTDALAMVNDALRTIPQQNPAAEPILLFQRSVAETRLEDFGAAIESLEEAVLYRQDLGQAEIYYGNLAELYAVSGDLDRARIFYQLAVSEQPSYGLARAGLASVLERQGRGDEAQRHWVHLATSDPRCSFLDEASLFFLLPGEDPLIRTMIAATIGDQTNVRLHMERLVASGASAELIEAVRAHADAPGPELSRVPVADCAPVRFARSNDGRRMAVLCDSLTLMEGAVVSVTDTGEMPIINVEWEVVASSSLTNGYFYWSDVSDIAYSSDDSALRLLLPSQIESLNVVDNGLAFDRMVQFGNSDLIAEDLVDGEQILFRGNYSAGFQLEPWDTAAVVTNLTYAGQNYPYMAAIDDAATRFLVSDGTTAYLYGGPNWTLLGQASVANDSGYYTLDVAPDGDHVAVLLNGLLTVYDADTMQATDLVTIPTQNDEWGYGTSSRFLRMIGDNTIAVSAGTDVLLIDYAR